MSIPIPSSRPKASLTQVVSAARKQWDKSSKEPLPEFYVLAVRGYYLRTMGNPETNDLNQYDDAIFIVSPLGITSWNANTDPTRHGWSPAASKYMARLQTGVWKFRALIHRGKYPAFGQGDSHVLVDRVKENGEVKFFESGAYGINLHRGGDNSTSSLGCQTIVPGQWNEFHRTLLGVMNAMPGEGFDYILTDGPIN